MNAGASGRSAAASAPCGTFISSTMIVMMMAMTPSENASSAPLLVAGRSAPELDAAAKPLGLGNRRRLAGDHRVQRVLQVARLHLGGLLAVVVDRPVVGELAGLVEQ